jgi:hypothetical protein
MKKLGQLALLVGFISLIIGMYSRIVIEPIRGIEAHAFLDFTQACFLLAIASFIAECKK